MSNKNTCPECDSQNKTTAKFCFNCGNELPEKSDRIIQDSTNCSECGSKNEESANFCANCGHKIGQKNTATTPQNAANKKNKRKVKPASPVKKTWNPIVIGLIILGIYLVYSFTQNKKQQAPGSLPPFRANVEQRSNDAELERHVIQVASKFICSCGNCGEQPLETCTCETAQQERQFIRRALQAGQSNTDIIFAVNSKYGWLKPEYRDQQDVNGLDLKSMVKKENSLPQKTNSTPGNKKLAGFADRLEIISHFTCPCNQCEIDELKECDCNHPNGATEVKQFIDNKIQQGTYSIEKIIEIVDAQYGCKKI